MQRFIRWPELKEIVGVSQVTVWRWEKEGRFPKRVTLGGHTKAWLESEIIQWQNERALER